MNYSDVGQAFLHAWQTEMRPGLLADKQDFWQTRMSAHYLSDHFEKDKHMPISTKFSLLMLGLCVAAAPAARAQVVSGVMTVTGAEMH